MQTQTVFLFLEQSYLSRTNHIFLFGVEVLYAVAWQVSYFMMLYLNFVVHFSTQMKTKTFGVIPPCHNSGEKCNGMLFYLVKTVCLSLFIYCCCYFECKLLVGWVYIIRVDRPPFSVGEWKKKNLLTEFALKDD